MRLWCDNSSLARKQTRVCLHNNYIYIWSLCPEQSRETHWHLPLSLDRSRSCLSSISQTLQFSLVLLYSAAFGKLIWCLELLPTFFQYKLKVTRLCHFSACVKELQKAILSSLSSKSPFYYSHRSCQFKKACYKWINLWQDCWLTGKSLLCMDLTSQPCIANFPTNSFFMEEFFQPHCINSCWKHLCIDHL